MISNVVDEYTRAESHEEWDLDGLVRAMEALYGTGVAAEELRGSLDRDAIVEEFLDDALDAYAEREREIEGIQEGLMRDLERYIVLQVVDTRWREHLENMDYMREGIHLRGMAQKDPLVEYRNEGHVMFLELNARDPRGGRRAPLPRAGRGAGATRTARRSRPPAPGTSDGGNGNLSYEHQSLAGADAIAAAGGAGSTRRPSRRAAARSATAAVVKSRAREHRPQRPVLVRLGQEVQALPRRLTAPSTRHAATDRPRRRDRSRSRDADARRGRPSPATRTVSRLHASRLDGLALAVPRPVATRSCPRPRHLTRLRPIAPRVENGSPSLETAHSSARDRPLPGTDHEAA